MLLVDPKLVEEYTTPGGSKGFIFEDAHGQRIILRFDGEVPEKFVPARRDAMPSMALDVQRYWQQANMLAAQQYPPLNVALGGQRNLLSNLFGWGN